MVNHQKDEKKFVCPGHGTNYCLPGNKHCPNGVIVMFCPEHDQRHHVIKEDMKKE